MADQRTQWEFLANDKLSAIIDKIDARFAKLDATTSKTESRMKRFFSGAVGLAFAINNAFGAVQAVESVIDRTVGSSLRLANSFEQTRIAFETFTGDAQLGDDLLGQLKHLADTTVLQNNATYDAGRTLLGFGVDASRVVPIMHQLGDISGGNNEKLQSLTLAFGQMSSAGRLMGQDLLQFINAGFNPLREISIMTGISMVDLKKKMEDGAISSDMVAAAFEHATSQGGLFFNMMNRQSETSAGRLSILQSNWNNFLMNVGQQMQPFENKLIDVGSALINGLGAGFGWLMNNGPLIKEVLEDIAIATAVLLARTIALNAAVIIANVQFGIWAVKYYAVTAAQWALNAAMNANPIGVIITAIGLLILGLKVAYDHFDSVKKAVQGVGAVLAVVGRLVVGFGESLAGAILFDPAMVARGASKFASAVAEIGSKGIAGIYQEGSNAAANGGGNDYWTKNGIWGASPYAGNENTGTGAAPKFSFDGLNKDVKGVSEGGRSPKNITVNIKALVNDLNINTTNIKEGTAKMRQMIEEELVRAVRDSEITISGS